MGLFKAKNLVVLLFVGYQGELQTVDTASLPAVVSAQRQGYVAGVGG